MRIVLSSLFLLSKYSDMGCTCFYFITSFFGLVCAGNCVWEINLDVSVTDVQKFGVSKTIFLKEMICFIQQGHIKLIKKKWQ